MNPKNRKKTPTSISGYVADNERRPLANVSIFHNGKAIVKSGHDGSFSVALPKSQKRIVLTFDAEGYVPNTRVFSASSGVNGVVIWPKAFRIKFDPSRELDIELASSRIRIPADSLATPEGKKLRGAVELSFTLFDVTSLWQRAGASGDFTGRLENGNLARLNSYGIFHLDLRQSGSRKIDLRRGAAAELEIAIPRKLIKGAPKRVGYFLFDRIEGLWLSAGSFTFVPRTLTYNGTITRFGGDHNLDDPQLTTCVTVRVVNFYDGSGLGGMLVTVQGLQYTFSGTTDANGYVCLVVDRNSSFSVTGQGSPYGAGSFWATPHPVTLVSPNIASDGSNCGDPLLCPFVGEIQADFVTGMRNAFLYADR